MKHDEVIEIAKKAGFFFHDAGYAPTLHTTPMEYSDKCFARFAKLVEQATLERAAKVCESWRGGKLLLNAGDMSTDELRTVRAVTDAAGREIRALKDSND